MALTYLGSKTVGDCVPAGVTVVADALVELNAKLAATLAAQASLSVTPPTIALNLRLLLDLQAQIAAQIALGIELPTISLQLSVLFDLIAALNLQINFLLALQVAFGTAGIHAYAYDGAASGLGPSLPSSFPGGTPGDHTNALVLATTVPAAWAALGAVLKTS